MGEAGNLIRPKYPEGYSFPVGSNFPVGRYETIGEFIAKSGLGKGMNSIDVDISQEEFEAARKAMEKDSLQAEKEFDWVQTSLLGISENYLGKLFGQTTYKLHEGHFEHLRAEMISAEATKKAVDAAIDSNNTYHIGGGHHHAHRGGSSDSDFNLINDILVGVERAKEHPEIDTTMVIDLDVHFGDGTVSGTRMSEKDYHFSMHQWNLFPRVDSGWRDYIGTGKAEGTVLNVPLPNETAGETYLEALEKELDLFMRHSDPDLVIYQSGVDTHHEDELGDLRLSLDDLYERDKTVYDMTEDVPTVTVTGGGYGPEAAFAPVNTVAAMEGEEKVFSEPSLEDGENVDETIDKWYGY